MEKKNLSHSLRDHTIDSKATNNSITSSSFAKTDSNKLKYPWSYSNTSYGEDYLGGFSWPPRSYTCSFCKREFRSAQALGGHMNVHRRDRARLRVQSPPRDNTSHPHCHLLNLNANPNPNPNPPTNLSALCATPHFSGSSSSKATNFDATRNFMTRKSLFGSNEEFEDGRKLMKKAEILRLDLEIGLSSNHSKEDLDLELRLGYS